jgi:hypothetical protein
VISGTGFIAATRIAITGIKGGASFTGWYYFTRNSSIQITLASSATWPGDTGSITWMTDSTTWSTVFGRTADDAQFEKSWSCILDSPTQITLHRNWDGTTNTYQAYNANVAGYAVQPYMLGIRERGWKWASQAATAAGDPTTAANLLNLRSLAAQWQYSTARDPLTDGFYYAIMPICLPISTASMDICRGDVYPSDYGKVAAREFGGENQETLAAYYDYSASTTWGDRMYGSLWGYAPYTTGGVYTPADQLTEALPAYGAVNNTILGVGKWTGFFFGMGMAHQWPAARLGGIAPEVARAMQIGFSFPAGAALAKFTSTAPNGKVTTTTCNASPCEVTMDARQGEHVLQMEYLTAGSVRVSLGDPMVVTVE